MPTTLNRSTTASSFFVTEDTVDASSRPWPLNVNNEDRDISSQSWLPPAEFMTRPRVDDELEFDFGSETTYNPSSITDSPSTAAAAFLSSFAPLAMSPESSGSSSQTIAGYALGAIIGHGGFSTIKLATSPSGGIVAVKIVRHTAFDSLPPHEKSRQRSRLSHEARVWVTLSHENVLPLFDSHHTSEATYLMTLYCPAGSLFDILKREGTPALEQSDTGCMFRQVVKGLQYMHENMLLVHGDIKLENVLVDESGVCRLTDFGLSRRIGGDSSQVSSAEDEDEDGLLMKKRGWSRRAGTSALPVHLSLVRHGHQRHRISLPLPPNGTPPPTHPDHMFLPGSLPYAAPELLLPHARSAESYNSRPTAHPAQDIWALGILLYALLTGALPFQDPFEPRLQMKILRGTYEMPSAIGPLAEAVLRGCLERDPSERWSIGMVDDASWGIGYGNVDVDPVIREEQRSESQSRTRTPLRQSPTCDDLSTCMTSCSLSSSVPVQSPKFRGRPSRIGVRSRSRSPSPSVAPRTPDDDDDEAITYFRTRRRHRQRDSDDIQIVLEDEDNEWDSRDRVYDERVGEDTSAEDLPLEDEKLDRLDAARDRQVVDSGGGFMRRKHPIA